MKPPKEIQSPLFSASQLALIEEATAMEQQAAQKAGAVGYIARMLVQVTMPHSRQGGHEFTRSNGGFSVTMLAASQYGLPYGTVPRLLLAWMTTEAVRTKEATLTLGRSLSEFLRRLGYTPTGGLGINGTEKALKPSRAYFAAESPQRRRAGPRFRKTYGKIPDFCDTFLQTPTTRENRCHAFFAKISSFATFLAGKRA